MPISQPNAGEHKEDKPQGSGVLSTEPHQLLPVLCKTAAASSYLCHARAEQSCQPCCLLMPFYSQCQQLQASHPQDKDAGTVQPLERGMEL